MEPVSNSEEVVRFGVFEVDTRTGELRKNGLRIRLQEQPFRILCLLLARPGKLVTRDELRSQLWPADTFLDVEHGLNKAMSKLRDALGDDRETPRFIETLSRRGYRFIGPLHTVRPSLEPDESQSVPVAERDRNDGGFLPPIRRPRPVTIVALAAETPRRIRELLGQGLKKDLRQRLQAIGHGRIAIEKSLSGEADAVPAASAAPIVAAVPLWRNVLPCAVAGVMTLVAAALTVALFAPRHAPVAPAPSVTSLDVDMGKLNLVRGQGGPIAISPNGRKVVFLAEETGSSLLQLYVRSMDSESITPLPGTQDATQLFFSPDSQWVGFSASGKLEKVPLAGGLPVTLCDAPGALGVSATWADNGSVYFITQEGNVDRVPAGGGTPQAVAGAGTDPGKLPYRWISSLPGSHGLLLTAAVGTSEFDIDLLSLETGKSKRLIDGGSWPRYLSTGQIVYAQFSSAGVSPGFTGGLLAVPFDLKSLSVTGSPIPVMEGVEALNSGLGAYDVAADGTLVYSPGVGTKKRLAWLDPKGKVEPLPAPQGNYSNISISPGGKRVVLTKTIGSSSDIYIYDLNRNTMQRLTFDGKSNFAIFTPDGSRVICRSTGAKGGAYGMWTQPADGSGKAVRLTTSKFLQFPNSISSDGKLLALTQANPKTGFDIYVMHLEVNGKPQVFLHTPYGELLPNFSPNGKWIVYTSNESGMFQVYVQALLGTGAKYQISTGGGDNPQWSRDGKNIYYNVGDNLMEVDVTTRPTFSAGTPRLVAANLGIFQDAWNFAVARDGRVLLAQRVQQSQQGNPLLHVVLHFATEVQNRLSAAKQ